jgi:hypothetical protein
MALLGRGGNSLALYEVKDNCCFVLLRIGVYWILAEADDSVWYFGTLFRLYLLVIPLTLEHFSAGNWIHFF